MLFNVVFSVLALASAVVAVNNRPVFTATRAFKTLTDVAPYIVTKTTTLTWTQSPSTAVAEPTGPGL